jgi:tetratricopeptide (TPR) repeat protein
VHMNRADAYLASGRWDEARQRCNDAHDADADDATVLECLAAVSLATSSPPPTQTARALLHATNRSQAHLLAAQLLIKDGRHPEAKEVLQNIRSMAPNLQRYRDASLGDVLYYEGDYDGAYQAWRDVGIGGPLGDLTVHRQRMVRLAQRPPSTWAEELPAFVRDAARHKYGAEESHYLAAQIGETYDDPDITARHLTGLTDRFPTAAAASDVPQRLLRLCTSRLTALYNAERYADQVGFYRDCWRDELDDVVISVDAQQITADAFGRLGLWNDALEIQRRVANILIRNDRERPAALESLATLYARTGRTDEALETVRYARTKNLVADRGWAFDLVEADALAASGDVQSALVAWRRAEQHPLGRAEATVRRAVALAEADRCHEALPVLQRIAQERQALIDAKMQPEDAQLAVARCLLDDNKFEDAVALAKVVGSETAVPHYRSQAGWIAAVATTRLGGTPDLPDDVELDPFWRRRLEEAKADAELDQRIEKAL